MRILLTAFEAFADDEINYSKEVLKKITNIQGLVKEVLPVEYLGSFKKLQSLIEKEQPNKIILLGEARKYKSVGFEVIAINEFGEKPDSSGYIHTKRKIIATGDDGLFSTLDYAVFAKELTNKNVNFFRSFSAGTYVCNAVLYQCLHYLKTNRLNIKCGFFHVPSDETQSTDSIASGLDAYLLALLKAK